MSSRPDTGTHRAGAAAEHEGEPPGAVPAASRNPIDGPIGGSWAPPSRDVAELVHLVATTSESVLFNRSLHVTLRDLCRRIAKVVPCDRTSVFLLGGDGFRASANFGNPPELDEQFVGSRIPSDAPVVQALARRQQPVTIADRATSELAPPPPAVAADVKSLVVAPICDRRGSVIGLFTAERQDAATFLPLHNEIVGAAAHLVALAVILDRGEADPSDTRTGRPTAPTQSDAPVRSALSTREWEVLELIARGHTNEEAAGHLHVSVRTIESHRAALMSKLGVSTRAGLVRAAEAEGVVLFPLSRTGR